MHQKQVLLLILLLGIGTYIYSRNRENMEEMPKVGISYGDSRYLPLMTIADGMHDDLKNIDLKGNMFCGVDKNGHKFCFEATDGRKLGKIECNTHDDHGSRIFANCKYIAPK